MPPGYIPRTSLSAHCIESLVERFSSVSSPPLPLSSSACEARLHVQCRIMSITCGVGEFDWDFWSPVVAGVFHYIEHARIQFHV